MVYNIGFVSSRCLNMYKKWSNCALSWLYLLEEVNDVEISVSLNWW